MVDNEELAEGLLGEVQRVRIAGMSAGESFVSS